MNCKTQLFQPTATVQIPRLLIEYTNNKSPYQKLKKSLHSKTFDFEFMTESTIFNH